MIGLPASHSTGAMRKIPQEVVDVPVRLEQALPRVDPHQVADPERRHQQHEDQALTLPGEPRGVVRDRVADHQADHARGEHERERADQRIEVDPAGGELLKRRGERAEAPPPRLVDGERRAEERIDRAERHRNDDVERQDEQDDQPDEARRGERRPVPTRVVHAGPFIRGGPFAASLAPRRRLGASHRPGSRSTRRARAGRPRASTRSGCIPG